MSKPLFIVIQIIVNLIRAILWPLNVEILPLIIPAFKRRKEFERLNVVDPLCKPFKEDGLLGHVMFHVSSEGELEQVRPLISWCIENRKHVELVYTSPSVEKKCQKLAMTSEGKIRILRLPALHFCFFSFRNGLNLSQWSSAKKIVMCRYDFFPELLLLGNVPSTKFYLVNASIKGKEHLHGIVHWYFKSIYSLFDFIICATNKDKEDIRYLLEDHSLEPKMEVFDFRVMQIKKRIDNAMNTIKGANLDECLEELWKKYPRTKRLIMGSAWDIEMNIFRSREFVGRITAGDLLVAIAPHKLNRENINLLENHIEKIANELKTQIPIYNLRKGASKEELNGVIAEFLEAPGLIMCEIPGVLCELYKFFGHAFVGGGHGRSIHSVLEPFVAGARAYCGPKTFRSTEFDMISEFSELSVKVIDMLPRFYETFKVTEDQTFDEQKHCEFVDGNINRFKDIVSKLNLD